MYSIALPQSTPLWSWFMKTGYKTQQEPIMSRQADSQQANSTSTDGVNRGNTRLQQTTLGQ